MTPEELRCKKRLLSAAMNAGDYETAQALATELEPYCQPVEDDYDPAPIPMWGPEA